MLQNDTPIFLASLVTIKRDDWSIIYNFRNLENDFVTNLLHLNSIQRAYHTERFQISLLN